MAAKTESVETVWNARDPVEGWIPHGRSEEGKWIYIAPLL